jgi:hypothetical protein
MASFPPEPPPPPPGPPDEPDPGTQPPEVCPYCGSPHEPLQEYCLECGRRLPSPYAVRTTVWSRESPVWLWAALAALLLVALVAGAVAALAAAGDDEEAGGRASVPVVSSTPTGTDTVGVTDLGTITIQPPTTSTLQTTTITPTTSTTTGTTTTTTRSGSTVTWPSGKDGYTVVLKSTPTSQGRGAAARRRGLPQVGILNSSDYTSLRPGYYVTFSGIYDTLAQASAALPTSRNNGFPLAYVREVSD